MADIKLKNSNGTEISYLGVNGLSVPSTDGGRVNFSLTPSGKIEITDTQETDVAAYATAQVVDANLIASNIKENVVVLGITGTHQGGITPVGKKSITDTTENDVTEYATAQVEDINLIADNIITGKTILGIAGTAVVPTGSTNTTPKTSSQNVDVTNYATNVVGPIYEEISSSATMDTNLTFDENRGKMYKFTGTTTSDYTTGRLYVMEEASNYSITTSLSNVTADSENPTEVIPGGSATLTFTANSGYNLPENIIVTGATPNWNKSTGTLVISNATNNVNIAIAGAPIVYNITTSLTNVTGDSENPTTITHAGTATLTFTANPTRARVYELPDSVTVTGATSVYNKANGTISLSEPTGDVSITVSAYDPGLNYFYIENADTAAINVTFGNLGTFTYPSVEYSYDKSTWNTFSWAVVGQSGTYFGTKIPLAVGAKVYFRGTNSTFSPTDASVQKVAVLGTINDSYSITAKKINVGGCLSSLLVGDNLGQSIISGKSYCFWSFICNYPEYGFTLSNVIDASKLIVDVIGYNCDASLLRHQTSLLYAPQLPALNLSSTEYAAYYEMFAFDTSLVTVPVLPATSIYGAGYKQMFNGCTSLIVSDTQTAQAPYAWTIPSTGNCTSVADNSTTDMFKDCAGTRSTDSPSLLNTQVTYYTQNEPIQYI